MGTPSRKPRPAVPDKTQVNQSGGGKLGGEKMEPNKEVSNANTPMPELPDKTQENQVGGGKDAGEKHAPSTEVTNDKPVKMMLKDIKGML